MMPPPSIEALIESLDGIAGAGSAQLPWAPEKSTTPAPLSESGERRFEFQAHAAAVAAVQLDGTAVITGSFDNSVVVEPTEISSNSVEVMWTGLPSPVQKFVSLFKIIYSEYHINALDESKVIYKEANINTPNFFTIKDLSRNTR